MANINFLYIFENQFVKNTLKILIKSDIGFSKSFFVYVF